MSVRAEIKPVGKEGEAAAELAYAARLLTAEGAAVTSLAGRLGPAFHESVGLIVRCADAGGTVLVTGLGKSGLIGQKIAATLSSLGIASHFVHPAEAAHGDLGRFRPSDICLALSYSGETDEVVMLASMLRQDGIPIISITRGPAPTGGPNGTVSSLERLATCPLTIGHVDDTAGFADGGSPAPTCSTTATLALGDALALCAARRRNFSDEDFAKRHPGGNLGGMLRPLTEALRFVVGKNLSPVSDALCIQDALAAADRPGVRRPGALLLVESGTGRLTGIFTDADLRRLVLKHAADWAAFVRTPVRDVMTRSPATLPEAALVRDAVKMVRENRRDEVPVVDPDGRPVGLLDVQDLVAMRLIEDRH